MIVVYAISRWNSAGRNRRLHAPAGNVNVTCKPLCGNEKHAFTWEWTTANAITCPKCKNLISKSQVKP